MPKSQHSRVRCQHPPTLWNLKSGRWSSVHKVHAKKQKMSLFTWYHSTANRTLFTAHNLYNQRVSKRCRPSLLTKSALVYEPKWGGGGVVEVAGLSQWVQLCTWSPKNFGDLTPYLTNVLVVAFICCVNSLGVHKTNSKAVTLFNLVIWCLV
jgi:hypothetical protein